MALRHGVASFFATAPRLTASACCPYQQFRHGAPASKFSRWHSRPATNLIRRRRSPVWLAIWRTWAGFANSQHRNAAFATPKNICAHSSLLPHRNCCSDRRKSFDPSAPIAYATSVSPPDEAVAWPVGAGLWCWMRLSPGPWCSSCKSPRARILVLGTSVAHWPARWPRFELTERVAKS